MVNKSAILGDVLGLPESEPYSNLYTTSCRSEVAFFCVSQVHHQTIPIKYKYNVLPNSMNSGWRFGKAFTKDSF